MLAPPVRLRTLYVSVTVHSYNEKIWSLVVGKIPWSVKILLSVKTSALQYIYVLRLKLCYLWKHALQVQSWVSLNIEFRGQLVMQPLYVNVTFVSVKPLQHKTNSFVALNEIFCIFNRHCLRGSDFPTLFKGRCLSLFSNRWCNIPSCNWMLVIFIFSVIMGGGDMCVRVGHMWHPHSQEAWCFEKNKPSVDVFVYWNYFYTMLLSPGILLIICIEYIVWNTWYWCRFIDITQNTKSLWT